MDLIWLGLTSGAAVSFTAGGLCLRATHGFTRPGPCLLVLSLFVLGVVFNARLVLRANEVGPAYLAVVGGEALLVAVLGVVLHADRITPVRILAILLVLTGVLLLGPR